MPKFTASKYETLQISLIAERASAELTLKRMDTHMDIEACHCNGCPLDLAKLYAASPADFAHDVYGIQHAINRRTGELDGIFHPRHALRQ